MKKHSWGPILIDSVKWKHRKCRNCELNKANVQTRSWPPVWDTYYFEVDQHEHETRFGVDTRRVPYGCGSDVLSVLEDELFEI